MLREKTLLEQIGLLVYPVAIVYGIYGPIVTRMIAERMSGTIILNEGFLNEHAVYISFYVGRVVYAACWSLVFIACIVWVLDTRVMRWLCSYSIWVSIGIGVFICTLFVWNVWSDVFDDDDMPVSAPYISSNIHNNAYDNCPNEEEVAEEQAREEKRERENVGRSGKWN